MIARKFALPLFAATMGLLPMSPGLRGADWPMLGRDGTRNAVSLETGSPTTWRVEERADDGHLIRGAHGVRWSAPLGSNCFSSPVVSNGLVWIGTNNAQSGAKPGEESYCVLKCFRAADGKQVYEYISRLLGGFEQDAGQTGLGSSPLIEGDRLWLTTNRCEVVCLDISPLIRGDGLPRELWRLDLVKKFGIYPRAVRMGPPRPCSIGPSWKGRIFVTTNHGAGPDYATTPKPEAPSLVCLNKDNGGVFWTDNSPGSNILVTQFSSPTVAEIHGRVQVIVPESDGWVRAFDPETGTKLWEFDINAKSAVHMLSGLHSDRCYLLANAVVHDDLVYIASGQDAERGEGPGRLVCIDPTRRGDVSSELAVDAAGKPLPRRRTQAVNPKAGEKSVPNPNSALVWEFVNCGKEFTDAMHRTMSSVAIAKGLVIAVDYSGLVHCLDAKSGKRLWTHDSLAAIWCSPLIVDDKVYVPDEDGDVLVFRLGADPKNSEPISTVPHPNAIYSSPVYANGTLYVADRNTLFGIDAVAANRRTERTGDGPERNPPAAAPGKPSFVKLPPPEAVAPKSRLPGDRVAKAIFVPTPNDVVERMLATADVRKDDVVYDLGSGDGRIVIAAAKKFGCRAVGIEIDRDLVKLSRERVAEAKLEKLVTIKEGDFFPADFSDATVVAVYLYPDILTRLLPKFARLKPGSRIMSHGFLIPEIPPATTIKLKSTETGADHMIYSWTTPLKK